MGRAHRDVVVNAIAHRARAFGMVARRPNGAKSIIDLTGHHQVHCLYDRAGGAPGGGQAARADYRIGVEISIAIGRLGSLYGSEVAGLVNPRELSMRHFGRAHVNKEVGQLRSGQCIFDGAQAARIFRVPGRGIVTVTILVTDIRSGQNRFLQARPFAILGK
jgi:hypothetical protein